MGETSRVAGGIGRWHPRTVSGTFVRGAFRHRPTREIRSNGGLRRVSRAARAFQATPHAAESATDGLEAAAGKQESESDSDSESGSSVAADDPIAEEIAA
jgi:hypothetical protein